MAYADSLQENAHNDASGQAIAPLDQEQMHRGDLNQAQLKEDYLAIVRARRAHLVTVKAK